MVKLIIIILLLSSSFLALAVEECSGPFKSKGHQIAYEQFQAYQKAGAYLGSDAAYLPIFVKKSKEALAILQFPHEQLTANFYGEQIPKNQLNLILNAHKKWIEKKPSSVSWAQYIKTSTIDSGRANLCGAYLVGENLSGTDLSGAELGEANLSRANLSWTNLSWTNLNGANLFGANLSWTNLFEAYLYNTDLSNARIILLGNQQPNIPSLAFSNNINKVYADFNNLPTLLKFRDQFKSSGFRDAERGMTYLAMSMQKETEGGIIERWFNRIFFKWTCGYGLYPGHCLVLLLELAILMSFVYLAALIWPGNGSLWAIWLNDRVNLAEGQDKPLRLSAWQPLPPSIYRNDPWAGFKTPSKTHEKYILIETLMLIVNFIKKPINPYLLPWLVSAYFSLLSAFQFGWRDVNIGNWIVRIQPREYAFRSTGWVRIVSGLQSIISVYLFVLWVLSYFGRPFE